MRKIILFLLLLLPITSFAQEKNDGMTTIFEEHFDGWLYTHTSGMNATYEYDVKNIDDVTLQTVQAYKIESSFLPCIRFAKFSSMSVVISNVTGAYGNFILSFKNYNGDIDVTYNNKNNSVKTNSDGTLTFNVKQNTKQIILTFCNSNNKVVLLDDIVIKAPTSSIKTTPTADLSFGQPEMSADIGRTYSSPELLNPNNLPIKWFSSNQATATVDEYGNVTPHFIGTSTIYAIFEGNDDFAYQEVSYQLTTKRKSLNNEIYYDGFANYIGSGGNGGKLENNSYVGDYNFTENFKIDGTSGISKGYQCLNVMSTYAINELERFGIKNGKLNFRCAPSIAKGKSLNVIFGFSDNTKTKENTITMQWEKWLDVSIPISSTSQLSSITFSGANFFLDEISIISEDYVTIGPTGYATLYYSGRAMIVPQGITAYTMKVRNGQIVNSRTYSEGETLPTATAVVMKGKPGEYNFDTSTEEGIKDEDNQLKGTDKKTNTIGNDGDNFYMLANKNGNGVGFYWGAEYGAAFPNGEHKAYLAIPADTPEGGYAAKPCYVFTDDATTAIRKITDNISKHESYTLDGKPCPKGFKGIVITKGRKNIKR